MDVADALEFVRSHGVVLVAAKGPVPRLTEAIVGAPISGSWWGHPLGHDIFRVLNGVTESEDVLVCKVVGGKVTLVHRRLWPALIASAGRFEPGRLARVEQVHTDKGHHENVEIPFPQWVSPTERREAEQLDETAALEALGQWTTSTGSTRGARRGPNRSAS